MKETCPGAVGRARSGPACATQWSCPGGCGLCCGAADLAASQSICGLVAADPERSRRFYDPCCWSWEQLRQLIVSPTQAGFHAVHVPITDNGEIAAADGTFDIAVLGLVPTTRMLDAVVQSLVRCVRPGGLVAALQPPLTGCQSAGAQTSTMAASDAAKCVELLRKHGCRNISILNESDPLCPVKDPCDEPGTDCRGIGSCKPAHLSAVVAQVEAPERKGSL